MRNHHYLYSHNKRLDALKISLLDLIQPVVSYQSSMVNNPASYITQYNQSIIVAT